MHRLMSDWWLARVEVLLDGFGSDPEPTCRGRQKKGRPEGARLQARGRGIKGHEMARRFNVHGKSRSRLDVGCMHGDRLFKDQFFVISSSVLR